MTSGPRWAAAARSAVSPVPDRATPTDLAFLAMDRGQVPEQVGGILVLSPGPDFDPSDLERVFAERVARVPRLRQRLVPTPPGCGRPIWIDDVSFDIRHHFRYRTCPAPGDEQALLDTATGLITTPLPRGRPLWMAVAVTGLAGGAVALVLVIHHVLADGIGDLAVLAQLVDEAGDGPAVGPAVGPPAGAFPRRPPTNARLAVDALRARWQALTRAGESWRSLSRSMRAGGGVRPARVADCSLNRRTGPRRRLGVVRTDLAPVRQLAHRHGATVNDAALTAVAGALHELLRGRHERVDSFAIAVPVAGRRSASAAALGNQVAPLLVAVAGAGDPVDRLDQVAARMREGKAAATGPPPIALLGSIFRVLAAAGGYQWYMNHQHRLHTLVSHVRGPEQPVSLAGARVTSIIPVAFGQAGNMTVTFQLISYAGTLVITVNVDPDTVPDLPTLTRQLRDQFAVMADRQR